MIPKRARAAVVGVGHSKVYRHDEVSLGVLAIDACRQAIDDAGLTPADIDGVVVDPNQPFAGAGAVDGRSRVTPEFMINALKLDVSWYESVGGSTLISGSTSRTMIEAVNAVASGNCTNVLAYRALHNPSGRYGQTNPTVAPDAEQFTGPYGLYPPASYAHLWSRYMYKYGTQREQMAPFIVNNRKNALMYEHGYWFQHRPEPLTEEEYLSSRMISYPFCLFDCDIPVQGCGAFVITSAERAPDLRHRPAYVRGWAVPAMVGRTFSPNAIPFDIMYERTIRFGEHLFKSAGVHPYEIDVANLYDGFSIFVPIWLEGLGFCKEGEAFDFMAPERIGIDGEFPLNPSGGNLGAGRMHGVPHWVDSVLQIMGRAGPRQVKDAEVAIVTGSGAPGQGLGAILGVSPD